MDLYVTINMYIMKNPISRMSFILSVDANNIIIINDNYDFSKRTHPYLRIHLHLLQCYACICGMSTTTVTLISWLHGVLRGACVHTRSKEALCYIAEIVVCTGYYNLIYY